MGIHVLSKQNIEDNKEKFLSILKKIDREGISCLCSFIESTDFFLAPASTKGHCSIVGGLCLHSLNVYQILQNFTKSIQNLNEDSLIICGLLHDLCKADFYEVYSKNVKVEDASGSHWDKEEAFRVADSFPMGHGEKSVYLVSKYIHMTDEEAIAIRWHMSGWDDAARGYSSGIAQGNAYEKYPLAAALAIADMYATYFMDYKQ